MTKALDQIDYKIIEALRQDALKTNVQISEETGVSEGTVRNRLRALIDGGIIKIIVTPVDPKKLGFNVFTNITFDVDMPIINEVARQLAEFPQITYVGIVSGSYNIIAHGLFRSDDELLEFMTNKVASIAGIKNAETAHVLKVVKRSYLWVLDQKEGSAEQNSNLKLLMDFS